MFQSVWHLEHSHDSELKDEDEHDQNQEKVHHPKTGRDALCVSVTGSAI
jgi:hypothetical protein